MRIITSVIAAALCASFAAHASAQESTQHGWMAEPGKYASYQDALSSALVAHMTGKGNMPMDVRKRLASCYATLAVAKLPESQIRTLNAAARGEQEAPKTLIDQVNQTLAGAVPGAKRGDFSALEPYCPKDIPEFKTYAQP